MTEKNNEDLNENLNEDHDPTKEAFISDMIEMEEEIASEAYELVEHGLHLVETQFYDDGIEILRQAIGLYAQINKEEEIKAIKEKISEVYLLKEKTFREVESIPEEKAEEIKEEKDESVELNRAEQLLKKAEELVERKEFEVALDLYDEVENIFEQLDKSDKIENLNELIEECYNKKAEFLRTLKKETSEEVLERITEPIVPESQEDLKEEKLKHFLEDKKHEEEISSKAYKFLDQAVEFAKSHEYEKALKLYLEGLNLFKKLNWTYEVEKIDDTITLLEEERILFTKSLEKHKLKEEKQIETQIQHDENIDLFVKDREEQEKQTKLERLKEIEFQKLEEDFFKVQINNMASEASNLAHNYEIAMKKAIKEGKVVENCVYPQVIEIYKKVKDLLIEKGWNNEAAIYDDTINVYIQKFEQDKRVRQIEAEKVKKQKETEESLKFQKENLEVRSDVEQLSPFDEERHKKELEIQNLRNNLDDMTNRAERLAREYDVALRQGRFELKCPFPEIIKIFGQARKMALEKKLETEIAIFSSQIIAYNKKLERDIILRQIEAEKITKQKNAEEPLKMNKVEKNVGLDTEKLREIEKQEEIDHVEEDFDNMLNDMVKKAENLAREYDIQMKKAIKQGSIADNPPFQEIIKIYERARKMVLIKNRKNDAAIYMTQIQAYAEKLANDKKLRGVEAQKIQRQKDIEEMHKIGEKPKSDKQRLRNIEVKQEEEEFSKKIVDLVDEAEKIVREYELAKRKALRRGEIIMNSPYIEVIEKYKQIRDHVLHRGWNDQANIYNNQVKIYQDKLEKHEKLSEIEVEKAERNKDIEDMHKFSKKTEIDSERFKSVDKKREEEEFSEHIANLVDKAEKLNRNYGLQRKKAIKKGELLEETPYPEIIEIYKEIRQEVSTRGWGAQVNIYSNQIKIYQDKLERDKKLFEVEAEKSKRQKDIEDMQKVRKKVEIDEDRFKSVDKKREEEEFSKHISDLVDRADKLNHDYDLERKKALKNGELLEETPYPEIIEIYKEIRQEIADRGWNDQVQIYSNQIKIYQDKLEQISNLIEVEAKKTQREKDIEDMHKIKEGYKPEKKKEIEHEYTEEDALLDKAMGLIDKAEKAVKSYELNLKKEILFFENPYNMAIANYEIAREIFQKIDWKDEAQRLIGTIKFYEEKKDKDDKLRELETKKLEEPQIQEMAGKTKSDKDLLERQKKIMEFEQKKKEVDETAAKIYNFIQGAEKMAQEYEMKIQAGIFDYDNPYDKIIEIYRDAKNQFEEVGWKEESVRLLETIKYYNEKKEQDKKIRTLEAEKIKQREQDLLYQQKLSEQARVEQDELLKEKEESRLLRRENVVQFETQKDKAFRLMDNAKSELNQNNFENAIELYKDSEVIFTEIGWQEGIKMVNDSIIMIKNKNQAFKLQKKAKSEEKLERLRIEEKLEEQFTKSEEIRRLQQEEKRKELQRIQLEKEREKEISEEAYQLLEKGTALLENTKFDEAYEKYIKARELFNNISWKREVSRINNELLFILKRERRKVEILEDIKVKKAEESKKMETLKLETKKERKELEKRKKEEKRFLAKEEIDKKLSRKLEKAYKFIDDHKYNEGVLLLMEEFNRLDKLDNQEETKKISEQIEKIKSEADVFLITFEKLTEEEKGESFEPAYKALDKAQISLENNRIMKAISELKEAKFNLEKLKIGNKYVKKIDNKISVLSEKLGKKSIKETPEAKTLVIDDENERLSARIAARRAERKKKVLDLLKKD